jgi:hypothetical protein
MPPSRPPPAKPLEGGIEEPGEGSEDPIGSLSSSLPSSRKQAESVNGSKTTQIRRPSFTVPPESFMNAPKRCSVGGTFRIIGVKTG